MTEQQHDAAARVDERERVIVAVMTRTGKTREQVEAFLKLAGHSLGWRPRMDDDEFRATFDEFVDHPTGKEAQHDA